MLWQFFVLSFAVEELLPSAYTAIELLDVDVVWLFFVLSLQTLYEVALTGQHSIGQ